jgi:hypothetical protein
VSEIFQPIEDEWVEAIVRRDIAAAGDILADDFVQSREGGGQRQAADLGSADA